MLPVFLQGHNYLTQHLLRAINLSGKLHMVPALINDDVVIRFCVCAQNATEEDITYAWNVISNMAQDVMNVCTAAEGEEVVRELERIASVEVDSEEEELLNGFNNGDDDGASEDDVFLYDNNIPSIPSIPVKCTVALEEQTAAVETIRRRNMLLRMISDPKCYSPRILKSLPSVERHQSDEGGKVWPDK